MNLPLIITVAIVTDTAETQLLRSLRLTYAASNTFFFKILACYFYATAYLIAEGCYLITFFPLNASLWMGEGRGGGGVKGSTCLPLASLLFSNKVGSCRLTIHRS